MENTRASSAIGFSSPTTCRNPPPPTLPLSLPRSPSLPPQTLPPHLSPLISLLSSIAFVRLPPLPLLFLSSPADVVWGYGDRPSRSSKVSPRRAGGSRAATKRRWPCTRYSNRVRPSSSLSPLFPAPLSLLLASDRLLRVSSWNLWAWGMYSNGRERERLETGRLRYAQKGKVVRLRSPFPCCSRRFKQPSVSKCRLTFWDIDA
jgi:hypothetical protein